MTNTLVKALIVLVPAEAVLAWSVASWSGRPTRGATVQLLGAAGVTLVAVAHICEAVGFLPWFGWGAERSVGHYLDLTSALVGVTCLPVGYLLRRRERSG